MSEKPVRLQDELRSLAEENERLHRAKDARIAELKELLREAEPWCPDSDRYSEPFVGPGLRERIAAALEGS